MKKRRALLLMITFIILTCVWLWWGNTSIQTTHINIGNKGIPIELDGFTIVHVSDLHNAAFGSHQDRLLGAIKNASPDIIAVTGDLIDINHPDVAKAMDFMNGAVKIMPVYFVTGNHEAWSEHYQELKKQMLTAGVHILEDESLTVKHAGEPIRLLGLNDPAFIATGDIYQERAIMETKLEDMLGENSAYTILLSHRAELFDIYAQHNIDLVLSGHAHGGQVRLPFVGGLFAPNQGFFPKYSQGVYQNNQTKMIVSRGLGNSLVPIRVNNRPELLVVTLRSQ